MRGFSVFAGSIVAASLSVPAVAHANADSITFGTTDSVQSLDPAAAWDLGSMQLIGGLYQTLMAIPPGGNQPKPSAAQRCAFKTAKTYVCTLRRGLKFSNGDRLTAADVKFSLDRVVKIADPVGPSTLLHNLARVEASSTRTVTMRLRRADATWPSVLAHTVSAIVPRTVFPARRLLADAKVVGSGPYELDRLGNRRVVLTRNPRHSGPPAKTRRVTVEHFDSSAALKGAIERGAVDVAFRDFAAADAAQLRTHPGVQVLEGPGAEIRYLVFDLRNRPVDNVAVRRAIAQVIDRRALASTVFADTVTPLYSLLPAAIDGARPVFQTAYGEPSVANAQATLAAAGITTPVALDAWHTPTRYGPEEGAALGEIRRQLEASGLFTVTVGAQEWDAYKESAFVRHRFSTYALGWFPDFVDGDAFLSPFLRGGGFVDNGYENAALDRLLDRQLASRKRAERLALLGQVQDVLARDVPLLPLWERKQVVAVRTGVQGVEATFDPSLQMRFWLVTKP